MTADPAAAQWALQELHDAIEVEGPPPCQTSDPDLWFTQSNRTMTAEAVNLCRVKCHVREQCLAYALAADERHGVWGGLDSPDGKSLVG